MKYARYISSVAALVWCVMAPVSSLAAVKVQEVARGVWFIEDHSLPIVTVKVAYEDSGAARDPKGKEGLASFAGQLLDEGAGDMNALAFHRALEDHAIKWGVNTSEDMMELTLQTPSESQEKALSLLTLALTRPRFDADAVERIRASIESDIKQAEEDPGYVASRRWKELAFPGHPYGHPKRGTSASLPAITTADLEGFAKQHLACYPKQIAVVGDITAPQIQNWLKALSAKPEICSFVTPLISEAALPAGTAPAIVEMSVPQTVVIAGLPAVARSDPRYYAAYVLNHILGGNTLTSRLGKEIRDKRGLAYYADTDIELYDHAYVLFARFATRNAEAMKALSVFTDELKAVREQGVTQEEVMAAKNYLTGSFPLAIDNQNALAAYLISMQHFKLGPDYLGKRNSFINAVTLGEVNAAAKLLLAPAPLVVMAGQPTQIKNEVKQ